MTEVWLERWEEGRIGWHEAAGNAGLRKHWQTTGHRVLVPLCGKTPDLVWLAEHGNDVVGVELSELAVRAFFAEQSLEFTVQDQQLPAFMASTLPITVYCGDYFRLASLQCDAHYDRAALIAMPVEMRARYAAHTDSLLTDTPCRLVITLDYDQTVVDGPPYAVPDDELLTYWPELRCVDAHDDLANGPPKFREAGLEAMIEKVWRT